MIPIAPEIIRQMKESLYQTGWHQGDFHGLHGEQCVVAAFNAIVVPIMRSERIDMILGTELGHALHALDEACADSEKGVGFPERVIGFNDTPGRTFTEMIDMLDQAEKIAEREHADRTSLRR